MPSRAALGSGRGASGRRASRPARVSTPSCWARTSRAGSLSGPSATTRRWPDLTDVDLVRAHLGLRVPASVPAGFAWEASIVVDFFSVEVLTLTGLVRTFVLFAIDLETRRV